MVILPSLLARRWRVHVAAICLVTDFIYCHYHSGEDPIIDVWDYRATAFPGMQGPVVNTHAEQLQCFLTRETNQLSHSTTSDTLCARD